MSAATAQVDGDTEPTAIGTVHLDIVNLERSVAWWRDVVGLRVLRDEADGVTLGVDDGPFVVLHPGAKSAASPRYTGLYHLAIYVPDEPALAHVLARLIELRAWFSATDHAGAKSLYVTDPDGIGLEIALETPERVRSVSWPETERTPIVIGADGQRMGALEPLELEPILAAVPDADPSEPIAPQTRVGHVHLAVASLEDMYSFYRDTLGFAPINYVPVVGYGDLGRSGNLNHLVAVNTWHTAGAPQQPPGMAGMRHFTVQFASQETLRRVVDKLEDVSENGTNYLTRDPAGNAIALAASRL